MDLGINPRGALGAELDDEAIAVANDSYLGLQSAVYTRSLRRAFRYVDALRTGNVVVNDSTDYWEAHEPF
ncbi:MAG: aldehyde dehydrogenase family protein, partial [Bryobacteraceae bacterium]|nr:aldehyde dehydrogenase family protein [Bryobacteraceae bacterium]